MRPIEKIAQLEGPDGRCVKKPPSDYFENDQNRQGDNQIAEDPSSLITDGINPFGKGHPFTFLHFLTPLFQLEDLNSPVLGSFMAFLKIIQKK
jgi:hypothetical protein